MNSRVSWWSITVLVFGEIITFIDLGVDLYTGEMTGTDLIRLLAFCMIQAVIIRYIILRRKRKSKE